MVSTAAKPATDWELIERDYRAGILSVREIAAANSVSHTAIAKRAKRDGWERDLAAKIVARAEALVAKREVSASVASGKAATDREIIEANAERIAQVRAEHRGNITRMRSLVLRLLEECEAEAADPGVFAGLGDMMRSPDEYGTDRLNDAYMKAISLPQRIKGVKELAETLKTLVGLEREAYGLDANAAPDKDALTDLLHRIASGNGSTVKPVQYDPEA